MIPMENGNDGEDTEEDHQVSDLIDEALSAEIDVDQEILEAEPEKGVVMVLGAGARVAMVVEGLEARGRTAVACAVTDSGQQQYREVLGQLEGAKGAFVWLVDTWGQGGDEDQVIGVAAQQFRDFLNVFSAAALQSLLVVLCGGAPHMVDTMRQSLEDVSQ